MRDWSGRDAFKLEFHKSLATCVEVHEVYIGRNFTLENPKRCAKTVFFFQRRNKREDGAYEKLLRLSTIFLDFSMKKCLQFPISLRQLELKYVYFQSSNPISPLNLYQKAVFI